MRTEVDGDLGRPPGLGWLILSDDPFGEAPLRGIGAVLLGPSVLGERARWRRSDLVFGLVHAVRRIL